MTLELRILNAATRRYLQNVHRYPLGVTLEAIVAWALAWKIAHL